jgi:tRNA modification GTPase
MPDTIYALSSAPGAAGVSVVRVSGPGARDSFGALTGNKTFTARTAYLTSLHQGDTLIDRAMVIYFEGPKSFTGEDVVEYHLHGSRAVINALMSFLSVQKNHRIAAPGEFTRRAFENGKMDLTEAEAVADLIAAQTQAQKDQALAQMSGALSSLYEGWRSELVRSLAYIEAVIDFPDEDVPDSETDKARPALEKLLRDIKAHLNDHRRGEILRDGIKVVVIGAPNAGKSSLVNALARRDVAIVSDVAGTTRDVIDVHLDIAGYPVLLSDTAGLRPEQIHETGHDKIESEGVRRAISRAQDADIKILVFDGTLEKPDEHTLVQLDEKSILVVNKIDARVDRYDWSFFVQHSVKEISVSARTEKGIDDLLSALSARISTLMDAPRGSVNLTRARHREALEECTARLSAALHAPSPELMAEDVRLAARALGRITGRVDVEDLLDVIFRDFCIGK